MSDLISRQAAIDALIAEGRNVDSRYLESERIIHESDAVEVISLLPSAQRWIPVSEKLPEVNTICLCTYEHKEGTCIDFGLYMKHGWFVSGVTAWMPLPEPYKEDKA